MQTPLKRVYSLVPLEKRMGKEYWKLKRFLQESQWWDRERIDAWQLQKLQEMVQHAYNNVPKYKVLCNDARIKPKDLNTIEDIRLLPLITKEMLKNNLPDFTDQTIPKWKLNYDTTSGSTGIPLGFYKTDVNIWMENAFIHSGWERVGWKLGDISAVLRGGFIGSENRIWKMDTFQRTLELSSYHLTEETYPKYIAKIEEYRPKHLQAYPSAATIFADLIIEKGDVGRIAFDVIFLGSENVYEWQQETLRKAFPTAVLFSWYGHGEQVVLAPWCDKAKTYHVWPFYGIAEIMNENGEEVQPGEVGEIVGTSFWNWATPFIRYRTMDLAKKGAKSCDSCFRQFPIIQSVDGRIQELIVTENDRYISMTAMNMHTDVFDNVNQFQFYQDTPGQVIFKIIRKTSYRDQDSQKIHSELIKKLGEDMTLEIRFVNDITKTKLGKYRFLEQKLNIRYGE